MSRYTMSRYNDTIDVIIDFEDSISVSPGGAHVTSVEGKAIKSSLIDAVVQNLGPEDILDYDVLRDGAINNGFTEDK